MPIQSSLHIIIPIRAGSPGSLDKSYLDKIWERFGESGWNLRVEGFDVVAFRSINLHFD